jgi:hypothetical protein
VAASLLKGWSNVVTDGAGNVTFTDPGSGLNSKVTASVASSSPYAVTITFARQMKAGTLPAVAYGVTNTGSGDACFATTQTKSATSFSFAVWDATSGAWFNMHGAPISVDCLIAGEQ